MLKRVESIDILRGSVPAVLRRSTQHNLSLPPMILSILRAERRDVV